MPETRDFHLGAILSVTTGHLLAPSGISGVHELLDFMTGDTLFTHQLPRACDECAPALLAQHPQLAGIGVPEFTDPADVDPWVTRQAGRFGEQLPVAPLAPGVHEFKGPLTELAEMLGGRHA